MSQVTGIPVGAPVVDKQGNLTPIWLRFITDLWRRTGGASGQVYLDANNTVSIQYEAPDIVFLSGTTRLASLNVTTGNLVTEGTVTPSGTP